LRLFCDLCVPCGKKINRKGAKNAKSAKTHCYFIGSLYWRCEVYITFFCEIAIGKIGDLWQLGQNGIKITLPDKRLNDRYLAMVKGHVQQAATTSTRPAPVLPSPQPSKTPSPSPKPLIETPWVV
jgi:hypothetical protein